MCIPCGRLQCRFRQNVKGKSVWQDEHLRVNIYRRVADEWLMSGQTQRFTTSVITLFTYIAFQPLLQEIARQARYTRNARHR